MYLFSVAPWTLHGSWSRSPAGPALAHGTVCHLTKALLLLPRYFYLSRSKSPWRFIDSRWWLFIGCQAPRWEMRCQQFWEQVPCWGLKLAKNLSPWHKSPSAFPAPKNHLGKGLRRFAFVYGTATGNWNRDRAFILFGPTGECFGHFGIVTFSVSTLSYLVTQCTTPATYFSRTKS